MAQGKKMQKSTILEPGLQKLFMDALKDIFWAEKALLKALPKINKAATNSDLQKAISGHLQETQAHVTRLEEVFELLGEKARGKKCEAMAGLIAEGESIVDETEDGSAARDVGIIMAAQKVEHYEIATYGSLVVLADTLGLSKVSKILAQTLGEEKQADLLMTEIAESHINFEAKQEAEG